MGAFLDQMISAAGLATAFAKVRDCVKLSEAELNQLAEADLLCLAAMADAARRAHRGEDVKIVPSLTSLQALNAILLTRLPEQTTGIDWFRSVALTRLRHPKDGIAVDWQAVGPERSQVALSYGADILYNVELYNVIKTVEQTKSANLPLLDRQEDRKSEISGLIERAGRRALWM